MKNLFQNLNKIFLTINIFFLQSYLLRFSLFNIPTNLQEILISLNFLFFIISIIQNRKFLKTLKNIFSYRIILILLSLTVLSSLFVYPGISQLSTINIDYIRHLKFLFFASLFVFIFLETLNTNEERKKLFLVATFGAVTFGIFSVVYNLLGFNVVHDFRLTGPLESAVMLAFYLAPFFIFTLTQTIENPTKINLTLTIVIGFLIIATRSMGAIGALFLISFFLILKKQNIKFFHKKSVKTALIILGIIISGIIFYSKVLPSFQTKYSSLNERTQIWKTTFHLLQEPDNFLKGFGIGQFEKYYSSNIEEILGYRPLDFQNQHPHNIFLLFETEYGILGLIFIIFITWKLITELKKIFPKDLQPDKIALLILLYFFLHGMIDSPYFKNDMLILFLLTLELIYFNPETKSIKTA